MTDGGERQLWRRLGLALRVKGQRPWLRSHAQNPVALHLDGSTYRVYFGCRDADNRAHIGSVELDVCDPLGTVEIPADATLDPGPLGHFDDDGVYPSSIVRHEGRVLLYYIGLNAGRTPPLFYPSIGLAVSDDDGRTFERVSRAPIVARSDEDPCMVSAPCVLLEGGRWRMWYMSGERWERKPDGSLTSWYLIKYAESADGIEWSRDGHVCIGHVHPGERNIARPCVLREGGRYRAWYSFAGDFEYRLGYAESPDGLEWERMDDAIELSPPAGDWDDRAQAYPWVFEHEGARYMLYSGNSIGRDGFGLAVEEVD